jgi:superfamily I DNA/RNA helicase
MPQYHTVLGDEVQDFNAVQAALIERLKAERYSLVGDSHQSIYGFRGAMNNSMSHLKEQFHCDELPLSITYRCSKAVVKEAYAVYKDIEAWGESTEGNVRCSSYDKEQYTAQDIILCRMNRPLVALAYALLKEGIACHVKGRGIGEGLVKLIRKQGCPTVKRLMTVLTQAYAVEYESARLKDDDDTMQRIVDKYESALLFCEKASLESDPEEVCAIIDAVFTQGKGITLSTVHKAKGLEAERAFILEHTLHESFRQRARQQWQKEQEKNILYVGITRAKRELVYM